MEDKLLEQLLADFNGAFCKAYEARRTVLNYLEEMYDIDRFSEGEYITEELAWVYGLDEDHIKELIKKGDN